MNNNINKYKNIIIPTVLIFFYFLASTSKMYFDGNIFYWLSMVIITLTSGLGIIYTFVIEYNKIEKNDYLNIFTLIFVAIIIFLPVLHNENLNFAQRFLQPFSYLGIGLLLLNFKLDSRLMEFLFLLHSLFFFVHFPLGTGIRVFYATSRNYHSVVMITTAILLYMSWYQNNKKIKLYPALFTMIISVWSYGRSGILTSFLLFIFVFIYIMSKLERKMRYFICVSLIVAVVSLLTLNVGFAEESIFEEYLGSFINKGFTDSARTNIILEYFNLFTDSIQNFLFGVNLDGNSLFERYGYNLHNSYLRLHSTFGIFGILSFIYLFINAMKKYWSNHKLIIGFLLVILLRISTDTIAFFDPILMFLLLKPFTISRFQSRQNTNKIWNGRDYIQFERGHLLEK